MAQSSVKKAIEEAREYGKRNAAAVSEQLGGLNADKRDRILAAALDEFAAQGYQNASTNRIVERAGISKGLLFHYFGDKAGLYRCLHSHVVDLLAADALANYSPLEGDVFEVMKQIVHAKLDSAARRTRETAFLLRSLRDNLPPELHELVGSAVSEAYSIQARIFGGLDGELLRAGLDRERVVKVIDWVCLGLSHEYLENSAIDVELGYWAEATRETDAYLDFLRSLFYKEPPRPSHVPCAPHPSSP